MPIYEYHCKECENRFEAMIKFTEAHKLPACPECGSLNTHKLLSSIHSIFGSSQTNTSNTSCGSSSSIFT